MVQAAIKQNLLQQTAPHGWRAVGTTLLADRILDSVLGGVGGAVRSVAPPTPAYGANVPQGGKYFISEQVLADYDRWYRGEVLRIRALYNFGLGLPYPKSPQEWAQQVIDMRAKQGRELTQRDIAKSRAQGEIDLMRDVVQGGIGAVRDLALAPTRVAEAYAASRGQSS